MITTEAEALATALILRKFWATKGKTVKTEVVAYATGKGKQPMAYAVRSDMVNGMPHKA